MYVRTWSSVACEWLILLLLCTHTLTSMPQADYEEGLRRQKTEEALKLRQQKIEEEANFSDEESSGSNAGSLSGTPNLSAPTNVSVGVRVDSVGVSVGVRADGGVSVRADSGSVGVRADSVGV